MKLLTAFFTLTLLACMPARAEMMAMHPEIRLGIGERPGVMFAMLHNKGEATRLVSAASPAFARIELHTHRTTPNGMMRMVQVDDFAVPANGMLTLKPGGHHLMLFGFNGQKGENVPVTLKFADGRAVTVTAAPSQRAKTGDKKMHHHGH